MIEHVNLAEFAQVLSVSEPTLRKRLQSAPAGVIISQGKNGESYKIALAPGVAWWKSLQETEAAERATRQEAIQSAQLELLGDDAALGDRGVEGLTPGEQAAQLQAELLALKLGQARGELVRAADVEATIAAFMGRLKTTYSTLTDRLRRRAEISDDAATALDKLVERDLHELADAAVKIGSEANDATEGPANSLAV